MQFKTFSIYENKDRIDILERMMEGFPEQLALNEKLLKEMMIKIYNAEMEKQSKSMTGSTKRRYGKQELRNQLAKLKKRHPEKRCFIKDEKLFYDGSSYEFSEKTKRLVRTSQPRKSER